MKHWNLEQIDRFTERFLAAAAIIAAAAGLAADHWPMVSVVLLVVLAAALVLVAVVSELARKPLERDDYCDSDSHLADVARDQGRQA